jgi:hypothetical protein
MVRTGDSKSPRCGFESRLAHHFMKNLFFWIVPTLFLVGISLAFWGQMRVEKECFYIDGQKMKEIGGCHYLMSGDRPILHRANCPNH